MAQGSFKISKKTILFRSWSPLKCLSEPLDHATFKSILDKRRIKFFQIYNIYSV